MKKEQREKKKRRIRARIVGTAERPRASVHRSLASISVQLIDDEKKRTLLAAYPAGKADSKVEQARKVGLSAAEQARKAGISKVVFDRGGYRYHGRVQALAEAMREGGLTF